VELIGSFRGSGRTDVTYLARRDDGQWVELSPLLWLTLSNLDGIRSPAQVADRVTADWGHPVAAEDVGYLIDKKLDPAGLVETSSGERQRPDLVLALRAKKVLLPARVVSAVSRPLRFLFWAPFVLLVTGLFLGVETFAFASGRLAAGVHATLGRPSSLLLVGGLVVCSIFVHEMGHASGCRYGGATPGAMGVGIYVATPAFFTDLSDAYRLGRSGRVRGDLGGVYFNAVYAVALFPLYLATGSPLLLLVMTAMIFEIVYQMLPFVRSDGYWAVSDLAGVPDLFSRLGSAFRRGQGSGLSPSSRRVVRVWGVVTMIVLPAMLLFALLALPALAVASWNAVQAHVRALSQPGGSAAATLTNVLGIALTSILLGIMVYGIAYITVRLVRMATNDASGPSHVTKRARRTSRLARTSLVIGAVAFPVAWSAAHIRIP
jgi:putative peptide zinc metalloprotease protein